MAKVRVIKKNDDYSMDYQVGDILEVTGTWYGGINVNSKTGIPLCLDKDEYEEIPENTDLSHEEYERVANYWKEKDAQSEKLDQGSLKKAVEEYIQANNTCALATAAGDFVRCTPLEYIMMTVSGSFPKAARSFMHWKRTRTYAWSSLINMKALANSKECRSQAWHPL